MPRSRARAEVGAAFTPHYGYPTLRQVVESHLDATMFAALNNKSLAAKLLGVPRRTLQRMLAAKAKRSTRGKVKRRRRVPSQGKRRASGR